MEDYSFNSSIHKSVASKGTRTATAIKEKDSDEEESSWTGYLEDLSDDNNKNIDDHHHSSFSCTSSLISDAATTRGAVAAAAWKISHDPASSKIPKKLKFRKTRTEEIYEDDSLEDTASSPIHSPKVQKIKYLSLYNLIFLV